MQVIFNYSNSCIPITINRAYATPHYNKNIKRKKETLKSAPPFICLTPLLHQ